MKNKKDISDIVAYLIIAIILFVIYSIIKK